MNDRSKKSFDEFYQEQWNKHWPELKESLQLESPKLARLNQWAIENTSQKIELDLPFHFLWSEKKTLFQNEHNLSAYYLMDFASCLPVLALDLKKNDSLLDMCSAPGGKALMIIEQKNSGENIYLNDSSFPRVKRLYSVLKEYLPKSKLAQIQTLHSDGRFLFQKDLSSFDKILLDAPCSSERHVLQNVKELKKWSPSRSRLLAKRQYQLLKAAWKLLKVNGRLVYSTCSISHLENDRTIEKFLTQKKIQAKVIRQDWPLGESTQYGWQVLPTHNMKKLGSGWGPMYISVLEKL